jgi:CRP-like cAMP-binding protein
VQLQYNFRTVSVGAGFRVMNHGWSCNEILLVRSGLVSLRLPMADATSGTSVMRDVGQYGLGTMLGELDKEVTSTPYTVTTVHPTQLLVIEKAALHRFVSAHARSLHSIRAEEWSRRHSCAAALLHLSCVRARGADVLFRLHATASRHADGGMLYEQYGGLASERERDVGFSYDPSRGRYVSPVERVRLRGCLTGCATTGIERISRRACVHRAWVGGHPPCRTAQQC